MVNVRLSYLILNETNNWSGLHLERRIVDILKTAHLPKTDNEFVKDNICRFCYRLFDYFWKLTRKEGLYNV